MTVAGVRADSDAHAARQHDASRPLPAKRPDFYTLLGAPALLFAASLFLGPLAVVLARSVLDPSPQNYVDLLTNSVFLRALSTTLLTGLWVTVFCLLAAYPYAWVMTRSGPVVRSILMVSVFLTFFTSGIVRIYAWQMLLNNTGFINTFLIDVGLIGDPLPLIRNDFAVFVAMTNFLSPIAIFAIYAQMRAIKPELLQAAQSLGARASGVFFRIVIPLTLPAAISGAIVVYIVYLGFYVAPEMLGGSQTPYVGALIFQQVNVLRQTGLAAAGAVVLLMITVAGLFLVSRLVPLNRLVGIESRADDE